VCHCRTQFDRAPKGGKRFLVAALFALRNSEVVVALEAVRIGRYRLAIVVERLGYPAERLHDRADVAKRCGMPGRPRQEALIGIQRFGELSARGMQFRDVEKRLGQHGTRVLAVRSLREPLLEFAGSRIELAQRKQDVTADDAGLGKLVAAFKRLAEAYLRLAVRAPGVEQLAEVV